MTIEQAPQPQPHRDSIADLGGYKLLTFDDIAARLRCSRKHVKQSYKRWGLRPVRIAGRVLIPDVQLLELEQRLIREGETL
jgi:hypothetical protein